MARVLKMGDLLDLVLDEIIPKKCTKCAGQGCLECRGRGFLPGRKTGEVRIRIKPFDAKEKAEVQSFIKIEAGENKTDRIGMAKCSIQIAVKGVKGLFTDSAGNIPYELKFEGGRLTDQCADELMNLPVGPELTAGCIALVQGVPATDKDSPIRYEFTDSPNAPSPAK